MFEPKYQITNKLLSNIRRIDRLTDQLNNRRFPSIILAEFKKTAQAVSSHTSTGIEGNPLPLTEVRKLLKSRPQHIRDTEKEVLNYNQALQNLDKNINFSIDLILEVQKQVIDGLLPSNESGSFRKKPVVVNNPQSGNIVYIPPDAADVNKLMSDLVEYINANQSQIDPFILAGIFHKQCVIVHPFMDGNGRTTRLITKALLAKMKLDTFNLFSFENYYHQNISKYFQTVGEYGDYYEVKDKIDFTLWLEYFTDGLIDELLRVGALLPKENLILDFVSKHGQIADRDYAKITTRAKATRALDFKKLVDTGSLKRIGRGRATYYVKV